MIIQVITNGLNSQSGFSFSYNFLTETITLSKTSLTSSSVGELFCFTKTNSPVTIFKGFRNGIGKPYNNNDNNNYTNHDNNNNIINDNDINCKNVDDNNVNYHHHHYYKNNDNNNDNNNY